MLGVCYYPEHWPETWWPDDARRMRDMGISFVRIGEFAWSKLEPKRGVYEWGWLDRAIEVLGKAGLKVVLGTPTATPPKWLMDEYPEIAPVDEQGNTRGFGSRRHYTFSSEVYHAESARIVEMLAKRYGNNPAIAGWQTDNEYGCHLTVLSWGKQDLKAFQNYLRKTYQTTDQLNEAWGNVFWSMDVNSFQEISLPILTVTETNPAARLDFWRFQSGQVVAYDKMQCDVIRKHSPGRFITHNFMGFFNEFDHWKLAENLDIASWDSYPVGFTQQFPFSDEEHVKWATTAHPDIASFHHDLYRGVGGGRFWVMEQQPGPVNWAPWNPVPKPGMIRLWTWEALAHGAEVVSYFRWRQAPFAQEQMHAGLNMPGLSELSVGGQEATAVGVELKQLGTLPAFQQAPVAIVYDYEASWITRIQPQGQDFRYHELVFRWYEAVRRLGLDVDFVPPGHDLKNYKLVLVPSLPLVSDQALEAFKRAGAIIIYGPRTGSKTRNFAIPEGLAPGPLRNLLGLRVTQVSSLPPGVVEQVDGKISGTAERWREYVETNSKVLARFENNDAALIQNNNHIYLSCWPDETLLHATMELLVKKTKLNITKLPPHIRLRKRGDLTFVFNYGTKSWAIPKGKKLVMGGPKVPPQGLTIWRN